MKRLPGILRHILIQEAVVVRTEPEPPRFGYGFRKEDRLKDLLRILQWKIVVPRKIHGRMNQRITPVIIGIADQYAVTEVEVQMTHRRRLPVDGLATLDKTDRIRMTVLVLGH